jgi:hypothetical protein
MAILQKLNLRYMQSNYVAWDPISKIPFRKKLVAD